MAIRFPSIEFFEALQQRSEDDAARFSALGSCDVMFGLCVDGFPYTVEFEGHCVAVALGGNPNDLDFVLSASGRAWREILEFIIKHGGADRAHSLEALTTADGGIELEYIDEEGRDRFRSSLLSLQAFFDQAQYATLEFE